MITNFHFPKKYGAVESARAQVQSKAHKEAKGLDTTAQSGRAKFMVLNRPEMSSMITAWVAALAAVDRSHPPYCGTHLPQLYVLPEPALLAAPEDKTRCCGLYHHYRLMRDALMFHLAHRSQHLELLTVQQWCNILQGKVTKQGKAGSRAQACSTSLDELLAPAFRTCSIDALVEFPVPPEAVPPTRWALWQENLVASVAWVPQAAPPHQGDSAHLIQGTSSWWAGALGMDVQQIQWAALDQSQCSTEQDGKAHLGFCLKPEHCLRRRTLEPNVQGRPHLDPLLFAGGISQVTGGSVLFWDKVNMHDRQMSAKVKGVGQTQRGGWVSHGPIKLKWRGTARFIDFVQFFHTQWDRTILVEGVQRRSKWEVQAVQEKQGQS
ncbi:hypothetical protein DFH08DRAFT_822722 [Mycena albidolilacea]|uniref:Uncharacterized protein n=1 Tax=Mycena albidolilacea TaxID=1033008 RepID=A0AAD6Z7E3_9AGAR|nr:hypothetical protein DFH08DRAFT_822722 [Mycena albidolilacea]